MKRGTLQGAQILGVTSAIARSSWRRERLLILCYHGLSQKDEHHWSNLFVSPEFFQERLRLLARKKYHVLPLGEAIQRLRVGELPPRSVVITFDDGFYNFLEYGLPALAGEGMPATLYLTTYYAGRPYPIYNLVLSYLFWKNAGQTFDASAFGIPQTTVLSAVSAENQSLVKAFVKEANQREFPVEQKTVVARAVADRLGTDFEEIMQLRMFQLMNAPEVSQALASGIDIQLHTHRHRVPTEREAFTREIVDNRGWLTNNLGVHANHFCYPSGAYRQEMSSWLRAQEVASATTCDHGLASRNDDEFQLPRFLDSMAVSEAEFESWLSGLAQWLPHRRSYSPI